MPVAATPMPASTTAAASHMDLLGGLDAPAPAAAQQGSGIQRKPTCFRVMSGTQRDTVCIFRWVFGRARTAYHLGLLQTRQQQETVTATSFMP